MSAKKKLILTIGDPAGCGPGIVCRALAGLLKPHIEFIVVGDSKVLEDTIYFKRIYKKIQLIDLATPKIKDLPKGKPSLLSGEASINYLKKALDLIKRENIKRLVTAPLSKEAVKHTLKDFVGHTEFLAEFFKQKRVVMMMVSKKLKVVLLTRHIPLSKLPLELKPSLVKDTLRILDEALRRQFKIKSPRLAITSVNPHAGKYTYLGKEEKIIIKGIKESGIKVKGPYPADTLFLPHKYTLYHCIITAYHDQAMIPFKTLAFKEGVNLTLGLPIIRTSPAHGVAFDLIRKKKIPSPTSMQRAIELALSLKV